MAAEAQPIPQAFDMAGGSKIYNTGLRDDHTGNVVTLAEYFTSPHVDETAELPPPGMTLVAWRIPADNYPAWMWREAAAMTVVAIGLVAVFILATTRRSP